MSHNAKPPKILTDVGLSMFVNTVKLRKLPLKIIDVDLDKLIWHFDMPVWEKDGTDDWNLTPGEVIKKKSYSKEHQKRIKKANVKYPIIITKYKNRLVILDGIHRLTKTYIAGNKKIKAKIIPQKYLVMRKYQS